MEERLRPVEAVIVDIRMPFWSMVVFMIKWAIAAVPAAVVIVVGYLFAISVIAQVIQTR